MNKDWDFILCQMRNKSELLIPKCRFMCSGPWRKVLSFQFMQDLKINFEHPKMSGERTVHNAITEVAAMVGENVKLRRGFAMSTSSPGVISTYLHTCPKPGR